MLADEKERHCAFADVGFGMSNQRSRLSGWLYRIVIALSVLAVAGLIRASWQTVKIVESTTGSGQDFLVHAFDPAILGVIVLILIVARKGAALWVWLWLAVKMTKPMVFQVAPAMDNSWHSALVVICSLAAIVLPGLLLYYLSRRHELSPVW